MANINDFCTKIKITQDFLSLAYFFRTTNPLLYSFKILTCGPEMTSKKGEKCPICFVFCSFTKSDNFQMQFLALKCMVILISLIYISITYKK